ncbi:MAG: TOMM precursor leader peptide-binding protein, partial [Azonexus sp.]
IFSAHNLAFLVSFQRASTLDTRLHDLNALYHQNRQIWGLARNTGLRPLIGPLFRPEQGCWHCLANRLRGNLEVESFLTALPGNADANQAYPNAPGLFANSSAQLAAVQLAKALVIEQGGINEGLLALNGVTGETTFHRYSRNSHCPVCVNPAESGAGKRLMELALEMSSSEPVFTSGGYRRVEPAETLERFRHLRDPLTGIVNQMIPLSSADDDWNFTVVATHRFSPEVMDFAQLQHGLRSKSSGKGTTRAQSMASALGEAIERYSGIYQGHEATTRRRFIDFEQGEVLHPNAVMGFSERQFERRHEINRDNPRGPFCVPEPFKPEALLSWTAGWSLTRQQTVFVPTQLAFYYAPDDGEPCCYADSNGASAGNTIEEAVSQGFLELVERDAYAIWWYNRLRMPGIAPEAFGYPYLDRSSRYYAARNREIWRLDVSLDSAVTVYVAVSRRVDKPVEDVILGAGAHFEPRVAALRAVTELNQHLLAVERVDTDGRGYQEKDADRLRWWQQVTVERFPWLLPSSQKVPGNNPYVNDHGLHPCIEVARALGVELLVIDQTRPDIGMPVVKVMAPGLRHYWPRLAPGRLYDVPVKQGHLPHPLAEHELTEFDVFV